MAIGHFERHLREAIALNRERAPKYAAISAGESRRISRTLIAVEGLMLPIARWFDWRAEPYERAGIPLLSSLFVSMSLAPTFLPLRFAGEDCLVRHLRESAERLSQLGPGHVDAARALGLPSPAPLIQRMLWLHELAHRPAAMLDNWARPLQARGIAILAQDLPPIEARSVG